MLLVNLFNIIRGYVIIMVEGYFLERFINICTRRQIYLWDIKKINSAKIRLKISINGFKMLRPIAHKTGCSVRIVQKKGLPFLLYKHRRRKTFIAGIVIFFGILWYITSFVWVIEVVGNEHLEAGEIKASLRECGFKKGSFKATLNLPALENRMLLANDKLSWVGIEIKGTKATVGIKERRKAPQIVEIHISCNIVSANEGVIHRMIVKSGQPMVKEGDTIEKGQLLVSGVLDSKVEGVRYVHAVADVEARTWYEETKELSLTKEINIKTGNEITRRSLKVFNFNINFFINSSIPYTNYDKMTSKKALTIGKNYILPIVIETNVYEEVMIEKQKMTIQQAIEDNIISIREKIKDQMSEGAQIVEEIMEHMRIDDNNIVFTLRVECIEEIGKQEVIIRN